MKKLLFIVLLIPTISVAQELENSEIISISAGAVSSYLKDGNASLGDRIGYFAGVNTERILGRNTGVIGGLSFISQKYNKDAVKLTINSINVSFHYEYIVSKLKLLAGVQGGLVLNRKLKADNSEVSNNSNKGQLFLSGGVSYAINRIDIFGRYNYDLSNSDFDNNAQIGIAFRVTK